MHPDLKIRIHRAAKHLIGRGATAVYLFGSMAKGRNRDVSDVDLAVTGLPPAEFFSAMSEASRIVGREVDLFDLDVDTEVARSLRTSGELLELLHG